MKIKQIRDNFPIAYFELCEHISWEMEIQPSGDFHLKQLISIKQNIVYGKETEIHMLHFKIKLLIAFED